MSNFPTNAANSPNTLLSNLQEERERLLNLVVGIAALLTALLVVGNFLVVQFGGQGLELRQFALLPILFGAAYVLRHYLPFGVRAGLLILPAIITNTYDLYNLGLVSSATMSLLVMAVIWALLLGTYQGIIMVLVITLITSIIGHQIFVGNLVIDPALQASYIDGSAWVGFLLSFSLQVGLLGYLFNRLVANSQETLNRQFALRQTIVAERDSLEERVQERTRALSLTAEASRSMSNILDRNQLLLEVVDQIQKAFNYYHVHIYQIDDEQRYLVMSGGTGEAGKALLIGKHKLAVGQGLVGRAATTKRPVFVPDVSQEVGWVPNPLLPETKAEIAVPILLGGELLGVLDVQHNITNGLTLEDVVVLESLGNQFAVSLRNAAIYEQAQNHARQAAMINTIGQKIQLAPDVNFTLQTAVREVGQVLNANRATITLDVSRFRNPAQPVEEKT